jgi:hypothetical protein
MKFILGLRHQMTCLMRQIEVWLCSDTDAHIPIIAYPLVTHLLEVAHFHFEDGAKWTTVGEHFAICRLAHVAVKVDRPSPMLFVAAISVRHFDLKARVNRQLLDFADEKVAKEVLRQEPIHDFVPPGGTVLTRSRLWLKQNSKGALFRQLISDAFDELLIGEYSCLGRREELMKAAGRRRVDHYVLSALDKLVVLDRLGIVLRRMHYRV